MSFNSGEISLGNSSFVEVKALIKEARQRQRSRQRFIAGVVLSVFALIGALIVAFGGGSNHSPITSLSQSRGPSSGHASPNQTRSIATLASINPGYTDLMAVRGRLYATDPSFSQGGCVTSPVNMATLEIETKIAVTCPPNFENGNLGGYRASTVGEDVSPLVSLDESLMHGSNSYDGLVRIVHKDPQTGKSTTGPVVFTFNYEVNTYQLEDAYGAGILWIYDCETPAGSRLIEVSATTGAVEETVAMPHICRAAISANADGFYLSQDEESYGPKQIAMYHVAPGAAQVVAVNTLPGIPSWQVTVGSSLWVDVPIVGEGVFGTNQANELLRYVGILATPQVIATDVEVNGYPRGPISGGGFEWVVRVTPKSKNSVTYIQTLVRINTTTGRATKFGSFGNDLIEPGAGDVSLVYLNNAVFALVGGQIYRMRV